MLSIFSSQLIPGSFARLCMRGLNKEDLGRHGEDKKESNGGKGEKEREINSFLILSDNLP